MLWNYIRAKVKEAFLAGIGDALAHLDSDDGPPDSAALVADLDSRLRPRLVAPKAKSEKGKVTP